MLIGKQRTTYLIDSENVNDAWIRLLPELKRKDKIVIFFTKNSPHFAAEHAQLLSEYKKYDIIWEKCFTGNNALDFQLVSRMGYYICKRPKDAYVIMSNDTGYDSAIKYWMQQGICIWRIRKDGREVQAKLTEQEVQANLPDTKAQAKLPDKKAQAKLPDKKVQAKLLDKKVQAKLPDKKVQTKLPDKEVQPPSYQSDAESTEDGDFQVPVECVLGICKSISIRRLNKIHEALVALLGAEHGREVYFFLRDNKEFHEKLSGIYLTEYNDRMDNYLTVLFSYHNYHNMDQKQIERIRKVLTKHRTASKDVLHKAIIKNFGTKEGAGYYACIKSHWNVLKKI